MKFVLLYQMAIANVFRVKRFTRDPKDRGDERLLQHAYDACYWYAKGLIGAGYEVRTAHYDHLIDAAGKPWESGIGERFIKVEAGTLDTSRRVKLPKVLRGEALANAYAATFRHLGSVWATYEGDAVTLRGEGLEPHPDMREMYPSGWSLLSPVSVQEARMRVAMYRGRSR